MLLETTYAEYAEKNLVGLHAHICWSTVKRIEGEREGRRGGFERLTNPRIGQLSPDQTVKTNSYIKRFAVSVTRVSGQGHTYSHFN
jgi:hypothetical protein